jgi:fructose-bisphosphate aldolase class II
MALVSMKEILEDARKRNYAVGCFNAVNLDMTRGVLEAAEELQAPVILCHAEVHFKYTPLEKIAPILVNEARMAKVPVALLLDHGKSFSAIVKAMHLGFNAVMYDGSDLPFEQNAENTKEVVRIARALDVSVEAELGHVVRPKSAGADGDEDDSTAGDESFYTRPDQAYEFVNRTDVDALAVAFGTAHGVYLKKPVLDLQRLAQIRDAVPVPLVMHGGSGLEEADFKNSISAGITKINYYTGMAKYAAEKIKEKLNSEDGILLYHNVMMDAIRAIKEDVIRAMELFGCEGKA